MYARAEQTDKLDAPVEEVRFAHGKRLAGLHTLGICTIRDLLEYFPFRYDDFSQVIPIVDLIQGDKQAVLGRIHAAKGRKTAKGGYVYEITVTDGSGTLKAAWFNQRWLADTLTKERQVLLLGKVEHYGGFPTLSSPLYTVVADEQPHKEADIRPTNNHRLLCLALRIRLLYMNELLLCSFWKDA